MGSRRHQWAASILALSHAMSDPSASCEQAQNEHADGSHASVCSLRPMLSCVLRHTHSPCSHDRVVAECIDGHKLQTSSSATAHMLKRAGTFVTTLQFLIIQLRHQSGKPHVGMRADVLSLVRRHPISHCPLTSALYLLARRRGDLASCRATRLTSSSTTR